jgi:hypothetical protein
MRNITGSPVENEDFFDRPLELARLQREISNAANLRINAPRRVGKTSLVLRLCEVCLTQSWAAVYLNVEDSADELSFAEKLLDGLHHAGLHADSISRCAVLFRKARQALGGLKVGAGIDLELGEVDDPDHSTLGRALESVFRKIEADERRVLIVIDEMPELLLAMTHQEQEQQRVGRFLHWLRALRQTYRHHIRWVFLGSIGLEGFVEERNLGKTINDLTPFILDALSPQEADAFLEKLGADNNLNLPPEIRTEIIRRVGWPLPHHLQVVFHALVDSGALVADGASLEKAFTWLLRPENLSQFDTWRQRLEEQFSPPDAALAKTMLNLLARHTEGRTRDQLLHAIMAAHPQSEASKIDDQLGRLAIILQRDGYLMESGGSLAFRSFLLREYWLRRRP